MIVNLPNLREIRSAILTAPSQPVGFPFIDLHQPDRLESIRNAPHLQEFLKEMRSEAERAKITLLAPLSFHSFRLFEITGDRSIYEGIYFDRRRRLAALALATVVDETDEYLPTLSDLVWEICNEYTWSLPAHLEVGIEAIKAHHVPPTQIVDLFAAQTAHGLAELVGLLGERLDPWLHYRIRTEIEIRIFRPIFDTPDRFWWESASMNWAAVCGGCVGMAALILEDNRERLIGMIDRVIRTMECFLEGFGSEGGCLEGIAYWIYGFGYYTYFAEMLTMFTDEALDLLVSDHIKRIVNFPNMISLGPSQFINFSDAPENTWIHPGFASYLSKKLGVIIPHLSAPDFHADHIYRWGHLIRDLLWTDVERLGHSTLDGSFYLDDVAWVVDKYKVNGKTIAFAAKGGHNNEPHNHNDLGHFILHIGGESLLVDLGAGVYTQQYFREERYNYLHTGSQGHSVPVINGYLQEASVSNCAKVLSYKSQPDGVQFILDLTDAYNDNHLKTFIRSFDWSIDSLSKLATLTLIDRFDFDQIQSSIEECFISLVQPHTEGNKVVWTGKHGNVTMIYDSLQFDTYTDAIETQTHHFKPITVYRLMLSARSSRRNQPYVFIFQCYLENDA